MEIGLGKGKKIYDKRETIKEREKDRDIKRPLLWSVLFQPVRYRAPGQDARPFTRRDELYNEPVGGAHSSVGRAADS